MLVVFLRFQALYIAAGICCSQITGAAQFLRCKPACLSPSALKRVKKAPKTGAAQGWSAPQSLLSAHLKTVVSIKQPSLLTPYADFTVL
ncbi:hypothetical protein AO277_00950 [Pseudomonas amygdali]|nr:hypothetical protein AO277_00950 [Pseudomonas amygdali]